VHVYRYKCRKTGVDAVVPLADWIIDDLMKVPPLKKSRPGLPFRTETEADIRWDVKVWGARIDRVIKKAGVEWVELPTRDKQGRFERKAANVKMFRHTLAVRQLKAGQQREWGIFRERYDPRTCSRQPRHGGRFATDAVELRLKRHFG
jgi:hypothetical protein